MKFWSLQDRVIQRIWIHGTLYGSKGDPSPPHPLEHEIGMPDSIPPSGNQLTLCPRNVYAWTLFQIL